MIVSMEVPSIVKLTLTLCRDAGSTPSRMFLTISQCTYFKGSFAFMKSGWISIRADSKGA